MIIGLVGTHGAGETCWEHVARPCQIFLKSERRTKISTWLKQHGMLFQRVVKILERFYTTRTESVRFTVPVGEGEPATY